MHVFYMLGRKGCSCTLPLFFLSSLSLSSPRCCCCCNGKEKCAAAAAMMLVPHLLFLSATFVFGRETEQKKERERKKWICTVVTGILLDCCRSFSLLSALPSFFLRCENGCTHRSRASSSSSLLCFSSSVTKDKCLFYASKLSENGRAQKLSCSHRTPLLE